MAPVHTESYGLVVPFAMAKNMPVVAYRRGVLPELLGKTNVLVNTEPEMVEAIVYLLRHPKQAKTIGGEGRIRAQRYFSMEKMIRDYDRLYTELLNRTKS